jgi:hypothetical protein
MLHALTLWLHGLKTLHGYAWMKIEADDAGALDDIPSNAS